MSNYEQYRLHLRKLQGGKIRMISKMLRLGTVLLKKVVKPMQNS